MLKPIKVFTILFLFIYSQGQTQILDTLINLGHHQLHFKIVAGNGSPILFEAGNGDDGSVWELLLQKIHHQTGATLITYDSPQYGT